ncbi:RRXRR domain-containing protein [Coleofasciculus sp. E1-EBD-02]|uniref:RRXRR domain-containing protein n=1 Tax=Coleofasciculus sp. E1-EBD-02 TaxID=3068481 RepID=UPI0033026522
MSNYVFLIDANKTPMNPIHPAQARKLMEAGKAAVFRRYPLNSNMSKNQFIERMATAMGEKYPNGKKCLDVSRN